MRERPAACPHGHPYTLIASVSNPNGDASLTYTYAAPDCDARCVTQSTGPLAAPASVLRRTVALDVRRREV